MTGQANAVLVASSLRISDRHTFTISRRGEGERRVCQAVRVDELGVVGNFHATSSRAGEQSLRAAAFVDAIARPAEPVVLCGDTNVRPAGGERLYDDAPAFDAAYRSLPLDEFEPLLAKVLTNPKNGMYGSLKLIDPT